MSQNPVTRKDFSRALREIGLSEGDICLFHSSFKSLGTVEGGAQAIIDGAAPVDALASLNDERFTIAGDSEAKLFVAYAPYTGE